MKHKKWPIYIWFLDDDLVESAKALPEKELVKSIDGCIGALMSTVFYFIGIRSKKTYDYLFAKEREVETMAAKFKNWPLSKRPSFASYNRRESKWCRSCYENFCYCLEYLNVLQDEYAFRHGSTHPSYAFNGWLAFDAPKFEFPSAGISQVVLPWKVLEPKFRRVDIISGYRLKFLDSIEDGDPFKAYGNCARDIPEFVLKHFNASQLLES